MDVTGRDRFFNGIIGIEEWVNSQLESSRMSRMQERLQIQSVINESLLPGWKTINTKGNGDCMIHALLIDASPTFRTLPDESKEIIAHNFRTTIFLELVLNYYLRNDAPPLYDNSRPAIQLNTFEEKKKFLSKFIDSFAFLRQEFLAPICLEYRFNVLILTNNKRSFPLEKEPSEFLEVSPTIVMYNSNSIHFEAMIDNKDSFLIDTSEALQKISQNNSVISNLGEADKKCDYENGQYIPDGVRANKYIGWQVDDRQFDGNQNCISLRLYNTKTGEYSSLEFAYDTYISIKLLKPPQSSQPASSSSAASSSEEEKEEPKKPEPELDLDKEENLPLIMGNDLQEETRLDEKPFSITEISRKTVSELEKLQKNAKEVLEKMELVKTISGDLLSDKNNDLNSVLQGKIKDILIDFDINLLKELFDKLVPGSSSPPLDKNYYAEQISKLFSTPNNPVKSTLDPITIGVLWQLAKLELILSQAENFKIKATEINEVFMTDLIVNINNPNIDVNEALKNTKANITGSGAIWKKIYTASKLSEKDAKNLLGYLTSSNKLAALRKAASNYYFSPAAPAVAPVPEHTGSQETLESQNYLKKFASLLEYNLHDKPKSKLLREFLLSYKLPGYIIQSAFDFNASDISDKFAVNIPSEQASKVDVLNGKDFVKSMLMNMCLPSEFSIPAEYAGTNLKQKLEQGFYLTQKLNFLSENVPVFFSQEITDVVDNFEKIIQKKENKSKKMSDISVPLYIIFSCQTRKKESFGKKYKTAFDKLEKIFDDNKFSKVKTDGLIDFLREKFPSILEHLKSMKQLGGKFLNSEVKNRISVLLTYKNLLSFDEIDNILAKLENSENIVDDNLIKSINDIINGPLTDDEKKEEINSSVNNFIDYKSNKKSKIDDIETTSAAADVDSIDIRKRRQLNEDKDDEEDKNKDKKFKTNGEKKVRKIEELLENGNTNTKRITSTTPKTEINDFKSGTEEKQRIYKSIQDEASGISEELKSIGNSFGNLKRGMEAKAAAEKAAAERAAAERAAAEKAEAEKAAAERAAAEKAAAERAAAERAAAEKESALQEEIKKFNESDELPELIKYALNSEKSDFVYNDFHTSIIFLCNGKVYTIGYGLDPAYDADLKKEGKISKLLDKLTGLEDTVKEKFPSFRSVHLFGTGFIYSPDSLIIDEDSYNYRIISVGILKKSHIIRLNKFLSNVQQLNANSMVVGEGNTKRNIAIEQFIGQTRYIYSRLASRHTQNLPFANLFYNCSSFVEFVFFEIICDSNLLNSDPNKCKNKNGSITVQNIKNIFTAYYGDGSVIDFLKLVNYVPDKVGFFSQMYNFVTSLFPNTSDKSEHLKEGTKKSVLDSIMSSEEGILDLFGGGSEMKLLKRKKQKRPKNITARKLNNKWSNK